MTERVLSGGAVVAGARLGLAGARTSGSLPKVELAPFELELGSVTIRAKSVRGENVRFGPEAAGSSRYVCDYLRAEDVTIESPSVVVRLQAVELREGGRIKAERSVIIPDIAVEGLSIETVAREAKAGAPKKEPKSRLRPQSFDFLDALTGHLNLDLFVDINGPLIGQRTETHEFRVPVHSGVIDYERLEGDVHWFERSFLDIEIVDDKLVLERNILGLPFTSKALVWWPLDEDELGRARQHRVALKTLLHWEIPPDEAGRQKKGKTIHVNEVAARHIDVGLDVKAASIDFGEAGRVELSASDEGSAIAGAELAGDLLFHTKEADKGTELRAKVERIGGSCEDLAIGGIRLSGHLELVALATKVAFDEFRPGALQASLDSVQMTELALSWSAPASD